VADQGRDYTDERHVPYKESRCLSPELNQRSRKPLPQRQHTRTRTSDADAPLVGLSEKAAEKVKEIRGEENIEESYALRLKVQGGGCSGLLVRPLLRPAAGDGSAVRGQGREAHL
jgi:hypothetical protein